jgi:signal peptidase I
MAKENDVIIASGELSALGSKKPSKTRRVLGLIGEILMLGVFTLVLSVSGQITYNYTRYSTFFVNGMSMYPTLNQDVYRIDSTGKREDKSDSAIYDWGNFDKSNYTYYCDYGMFDAKGFKLENLQRFDVLVTYFKDDMILGSDGKYTPKTKANSGTEPDLKIKRLIALPGETFRFDSLGDLYVKDSSGQFVLIEQSFLEDDATVKSQTVSPNSKTGTWDSLAGETLGPDEYFVCGDNRRKGGSTDSRSKGPVPGEAIQGRAVTIIGRCSFKYYSAESSEYHPVWNSYIMPWNLRWL